MIAHRPHCLVSNSWEEARDVLLRRGLPHRRLEGRGEGLYFAPERTLNYSAGGKAKR